MNTEIEFLENIQTLVWNNISKQELIETIEERKQALKEQLPIHGVGGSLNEGMAIEEHLENIGKHRQRAKMLIAIKTIKEAECESDVLDAVALKEEVDWFSVDDELKDEWNDYFGDAKRYLP